MNDRDDQGRVLPFARPKPARPPRRPPPARPRRAFVSVADMRSPPLTVKIILGLMIVATAPILVPGAVSDAIGFHLARNLFAGGAFQADRLYTVVTALFVHGGIAHLVFNGLWILMLGPAVLRSLGPARFVLLFVLSGVGGAVLFVAIHWGETAFVVGASGPVFGLIGAGAYIFTAGADSLAGRARQIAHYAVVFMVLNLGFALLSTSGALGAPVRISWEDHVGGFLVGLALFPVLWRHAQQGAQTT